MAQTANTQEPTMEEILASIRRIISEDGDEQQKAQPTPAAAAAKPAAAAVAKPAAKPAPEPEIEDEEDDVLELTDIVPEDEPPPAPMPAPRVKPVKEDDVVMVEAPAPPRPSRAVEEAQLISDRVRDQASSSFMQLARNVLVQETSDPRSLEHLVQEMLRPMLQAWLNDYLPSMVEGLVQQEIERVTRRERR